ncbi:MAG: signal recognition particle-docking protein FtsY [Clostridia bacterium]|nr:signal recognition particle-docking protein FtsY [Clostridia bacterium]
MSFFEKLKKGLQKTKNAIFKPFVSLFKSFKRVDEDLLEELEEILVCADVGAQTTDEILEQLRAEIKANKIKDTEDVKDALKRIMKDIVGEGGEIVFGDGITVILVIGVNGVGKTTSIGKIASSLKRQKKKVVVAAADTFRAAAIDQLAVWTDRAGVELIKHSEGSDPAAVVFDAINAAKKRNADVLIIDTAGRLHNKKNLMNELAKIDRVITRELPDSKRETLLVLDSTTGQNAVNQAKEFKNAADITGIVLTKLDGTAKGGIVFSIKIELDIPVKFIGVGEAIDDMEKFDADDFINALFE